MEKVLKDDVILNSAKLEKDIKAAIKFMDSIIVTDTSHIVGNGFKSLV